MRASYCTWATGIKIFVLVTLTILWIGHYRGHLCFTNTSCFCYRLPPAPHWPVSGPSGRHDQVPDRHSGTPGPDGEGDRPGDDQQQIQVAGRKNAQGLELLHKLGRKLVWNIIIICIIIRVIVQREVLKVWIVVFIFSQLIIMGREKANLKRDYLKKMVRVFEHYGLPDAKRWLLIACKKW